MARASYLPPLPALPAGGPDGTYYVRLDTNAGRPGPPPDAALRLGLVIHSRQVCWTRAIPWTAPGLPRQAHPAHGVIVACPGCGQAGVIPERGYERDFLPPGAAYDPVSGTVTVRLEG